ncbi:hypothetical protein Lac3_25940 [Claveliimonas bilis]|nr:hypothetical protein Lac3_25940 [Claveliimonas bilis]
MSIDYSDMKFPKPGKKKKKKVHKKSILNTQKGICYLCAKLNNDYRRKYTESITSYLDQDKGSRQKEKESRWICASIIIG